MQTLRIFLQQLIPAMENGTALMTPLAVLLAILMSFEGGVHVRTFKKAAWRGFCLSIFFILIKQGTRSAINREVFEGIMAFFAIICEVVILGILFSARDKMTRSGKAFGLAVSVLVVALSLYYGMEIWMIPVTTLLSVDEIVSLDTLVRLLGFLAGIFIAIVGSWLIYHAARSLNDRRLYTVFAIQVAALLVQQVVFLVQILMARGILPLRWLIKIMAPLIDHQSWIIFVVFFVVFMVPFALFLQKCPERPEGANNAQYRKIVAEDRHKKIWGKTSVVALVLMILLSSFGSAFANRKEELVPAVNVTPKDGIVAIPIEDVHDGHLHRYAYRSKNGTTVRFIIILKGGSAYGVGLDCCEICGPTGYIERDDQIVCKLCDVVMNKSTIGLPGGCNPIPLNYGVNSGQVQIKQTDLDEMEKYFR